MAEARLQKRTIFLIAYLVFLINPVIYGVVFLKWFD